jgi:type IV pilus assembly protein PilA
MIELMIVVAIVGILATLGIQGFEGAVVRARVADGLSLVGPLKFSIVDNLTADPNADACAGVDPVGPLGHVVLAQCTDDGTDAKVHVQMTPEAGDVEVDFVVGRDAIYIWDCVPAPAFVDHRYLPQGCRH